MTDHLAPMQGPAEQAPVPCLDCRRLCITPASRARRIGAGCWRKRLRAAHQAASLLALPGLAGQGTRPVGQPGPDLFDAATEEHEEPEL